MMASRRLSAFDSWQRPVAPFTFSTSCGFWRLDSTLCARSLFSHILTVLEPFWRYYCLIPSALNEDSDDRCISLLRAFKLIVWLSSDFHFRSPHTPLSISTEPWREGKSTDMIFLAPNGTHTFSRFQPSIFLPQPASLGQRIMKTNRRLA